MILVKSPMNQSELRVMLAISVGKHHAFDAENFDFASTGEESCSNRKKKDVIPTSQLSKGE